MRRGCSVKARLKTVLAVWVWSVVVLLNASAQERTGSSRDSFPTEIVLRPEGVVEELEGTNQRIGKQLEPFAKEPEVSRAHAFRRWLRFGQDATNRFALIWDEPKHKLYLDLNHNEDLTDDPAGVFTSTNKGSPQVFADVTLPLKTVEGLVPARLDLRLFASDREDWMQVQLTSHTLWQAKVRVEGEEWQVAVIDKLLAEEEPRFGSLLLVRPWSVHTNWIAVQTPARGVVAFPERLYWQGKAFRLERRFETSGQGTVCKLVLTPQQPPLAALRLSGDFLCYAVLQATNGYTLVVPGPARTWNVPQGVYAADAVWLKQGASEAYRREYEPLSVNVTSDTNLALGGPLTNTVQMERYGRRLVIGHLVRGADGTEYRLAQEDWKSVPEFAVYHGGKKVFASKFRYG